MKAIVVRDIEQLEACWTSAEARHPFQSWEWVQTWLRNRPATFDPLVIAVQEGGETLAIAPWEIQRTPQGLRRLTGMGGADAWYHDPLTMGSDSEGIAASLIDCLDALRGRWDFIQLSLREDSPLLAPLQEMGWVLPERQDWLQNSRIELTEGWTTYWQSRPASIRKDYKRSLRQFEGIPHRIERADPGNVEKMLGELFRLHSMRWGTEKDWRSYYTLIRALALRALPRDELFLYGLEIDGKLAAANFALACQGCFYGFMAAFRPEYSKFGTGFLLQISQLERACMAGIRHFNLGPGKFRWKEQLETGVIPSVQPFVPNLRSPVGWALAARKTLYKRA